MIHIQIYNAQLRNQEYFQKFDPSLMSDDQSDIIIDYFRYQWGYALPVIAVEMFLFYLVYLVIKNPGLVDFAWECAHLTVGMLFYLSFCMGVNNIRSIVFLVLLLCWFARLGGYILVTRIVPGEKDPRYEKLSQDKNPYVFFFINYEFQGLLVVICSTPLFFVFRNVIGDQLTWSFYVGVVLVSIGIVFEAVADYQLHQYKQRRRNEQRTVLSESKIQSEPQDRPRQIFQEGLWKKSRHPNLFFELVIWFGFAFGGVDGPASIFGFAGPIVLFLIMKYVTVPITEQYMRETRPEYEEFCKQTNMFLVV